MKRCRETRTARSIYKRSWNTHVSEVLEHNPGGDGRRSGAPLHPEVPWQAVKAFAAGLLILAVSAVLTRGIVTWVRETTSARHFREETNYYPRVIEMLAALPRIT